MGDPQVIIGFNIKLIIHDQDDPGAPPIWGHLHILQYSQFAMEAMAFP